MHESLNVTEKIGPENLDYWTTPCEGRLSVKPTPRTYRQEDLPPFHESPGRYPNLADCRIKRTDLLRLEQQGGEWEV